MLSFQGKFDEAEPLLRRAMAITEGKLGTDHPSYSIHLNNLAVVLKEQVGLHGSSSGTSFPFW